ncbi:Rv3235 family protein [Gordonia otitidis]|uniref:Rv3235 family protein n=1 Tax=Gordonia otitidis TaxID=249058 RepID=UPI002353213A|nr:Rv3235 family protein [Gordonia otitidis]
MAQPATVTGTRASAQRAVAIAAREFSVGTLTMIFEVMARRRPASHLQHRVALHVDDQIGALARTRVTGEDACIPTVRRVHVQMCDAGAAEIFGTYARQGRSRAFAGRIERVPCRVRVHGDSPGGRYSPVATRVEYRWQLVVLTLG